MCACLYVCVCVCVCVCRRVLSCVCVQFVCYRVCVCAVVCSSLHVFVCRRSTAGETRKCLLISRMDDTERNPVSVIATFSDRTIEHVVINGGATNNIDTFRAVCESLSDHASQIKTLEVEGMCPDVSRDAVQILERAFGEHVVALSVAGAWPGSGGLDLAHFIPSCAGRASTATWKKLTTLRVAAIDYQQISRSLIVRDSPAITSITIGFAPMSAVVRMTSALPNLARLAFCLTDDTDVDIDMGMELGVGLGMDMSPGSFLPRSITHLSGGGRVHNMHNMHGMHDTFRAMLHPACRLKTLFMPDTIAPLAHLVDLVAKCAPVGFVERLELGDLVCGEPVFGIVDPIDRIVASMLKTLVIRNPQRADADALFAFSKATNCSTMELQLPYPRLEFRVGGYCFARASEAARFFALACISTISTISDEPPPSVPPSPEAAGFDQELEAFSACGLTPRSWSVSAPGLNELTLRLAAVDQVDESGFARFNVDHLLSPDIHPIMPLTRAFAKIFNMGDNTAALLFPVMAIAFGSIGDIPIVAGVLHSMTTADIPPSTFAVLRSFAVTDGYGESGREIALANAVVVMVNLIESRNATDLHVELYDRLQFASHQLNACSDHFTGMFALVATACACGTPPGCQLRAWQGPLWPLMLREALLWNVPPLPLARIRQMASACIQDTSGQIQRLEKVAKKPCDLAVLKNLCDLAANAQATRYIVDIMSSNGAATSRLVGQLYEFVRGMQLHPRSVI